VNVARNEDRPLKEQIARMLAIVIILAGLWDPAFTITRSVPPVVAVLTTDSVRHAGHLRQLRQQLAARATVVAGPAPGADVQVIVGSNLPTIMATDAIASFVVTTPTSQGFHVERWTAPATAPLDGRIALQGQVAREPRLGATDSTRATLEVREDGALVAESAVTLATGQRTTTTLPYVPTRAGAHVLDLRLLDGRDTLYWRHPLYVRSTQWRVLVYDTRPSWLSTFVRRALERDNRFRVSSRVVTSRQVSRATPSTAGSLAAVERTSSLPDVVIIGAPDALSASDVVALDRLMVVHGVSVVLLPDHLTAGGTLAAPRTGLDALTGVSAWRLLPSLAADAPRIVQRASAPGAYAGMDSMHLLATAMAVPQQLPPEAELLGTVRSPTPTMPMPVVWRRSHGRGALLVSSVFDAWRFREESRSTFDGTWRDLVADAAEQRAPRLEFIPPAANDESPRSALLRVTPSTSASIASADTRPVVHLIGPDTMPVRLLPTNVANTWRAVWTPMARPSYANADQPSIDQAIVLRATFEGDTAFMPLLANDVRTSKAEDRPVEQLAAWAQSRGGRVLPVSALDSLPVYIATAVGDRRRTSPWHPMRSGWWIVPLALTFGTEWWLRRRRGSP
jgi:hypothetical protein